MIEANEANEANEEYLTGKGVESLGISDSAFNDAIYTAKEAAALLGVSESTFNNAVYRHSLARKRHNNQWYYAKSVVEDYRKIRQAKKAASVTAPLACEVAEPAQEARAYTEPERDSLDLLTDLLAEEPSEVEASEVEPVEATATPEPNAEEFMLRSIMVGLRRKAAKEQQEKFVDKLKDIRSGVMACHAMILTSIDYAIAEYETSEE